jgi:hypothetical protein
MGSFEWPWGEVLKGFENGPEGLGCCKGGGATTAFTDLKC